MATNPQTLLGESFDWEPVEYGIKILRAADMPEFYYEWGVRVALDQMRAHARANNIAVESIRRLDKPGEIILYFEGVKVLHEERRRRLQQELTGDRQVWTPPASEFFHEKVRSRSRRTLSPASKAALARQRS